MPVGEWKRALSRGWEIVADYVRQPEFQCMIDAATTKPPAFDVILVHSFSRFFRDQFQLEFYVRRLAKNGVWLASITQELGDDPMSNMIRQIMGLFDEYQSRENAKLRAMKENARQGFWNGVLTADRLPHRGGCRAARQPRQEGPGDRSPPGRDRAPTTPAAWFIRKSVPGALPNIDRRKRFRRLAASTSALTSLFSNISFPSSTSRISASERAALVRSGASRKNSRLLLIR
jgi:hypothetical protein